MRSVCIVMYLFITQALQAAVVSGTLRDTKGNPLPFSSVMVKGTTLGVSANSKGQYSLQLEAGEYLLVGQYIGHQSVEKKIRIGRTDLQLDFALEEQQYSLKEVVVTSGGEDPAYGIIRKAIRQREEHLKEIRQFQCEVYIKGQLQLRSFPKSFMGRKIDFEDGDTSKKKMIFLSETIARYSVQLPEKEKVEVLSTKVSGRSNAFGLSDPQIISFYQNNIAVGEDLNPRGFISPIANGALNFYRYKFEGTFFENGKEISRIRVIPRRAYEPLFSGHINIIENEWRIQSVDLLLVREQQLQLLDSLRIRQLYVPSGKIWLIKNQVIYPSGKFLGFDFFGSFVQVYDKFDMQPSFKKRFFDHTVLKFYDSSNKKPMAYWDSIRPLPLLSEEAGDYKKKDSLEQVRKDPRYLDSLDAKRNKLHISGLLFTGQSFSVRKRRENIRFNSILGSLNYNTVEGAVTNIAPVYTRRYAGRQLLAIMPSVRYGITNTHLNPSLTVSYTFGKKYIQTFHISGGRTAYQFNNAGSVSERINTLSTLFSTANHLKLYEANYLRLGYSTGIGNGLGISGSFQYQDRFPLENLPDPVSWQGNSSKSFTPNYPADLSMVNMSRNKAAMLTLGLTWRPAADYIEFPDRKIGIGSRFPTVTAVLSKGIPGLLGSDVDYTKWRIGVEDEIEMKLAGRFEYKIVASGFLDVRKCYLPDYLHFLGNQTVFSNRELSSFQLLPYYQYSNANNFNLAAHGVYHLNGLLSNKIPLFKKLNWFFVTGANALHIPNQTDYFEILFGIENIAKIFRVDFVQGFESGGGRPSGFRMAVPFL